MPDYIPATDTEIINWLTNLKTKIGTYAATLGIDATRLAQITAWCNDLTAKIQGVEDKKTV